MRIPGTLQLIGRALRHRNYRLFFAGQSVSLVGTWLTRVATGWLVYRLTGSALMLGIVSFASQLPTLLLGPFAGVWVDRWNRHRVLLWTQVLAMLQSALLALFALRGTISVPHVIALNLVQGVINAFDMPARQAFLIEMVDRADLPNAVALNSSMVNGARLLGPAAAGLLIASFGEGYCFLIDAISYAAVIGSLLAMRLPPAVQQRRHGPIWAELREGFAYVTQYMPIRALLLLLSLISVLGTPYTVLMPLIASRVLHGSAGTLGALSAASGLGAVTGALYLASRSTVIGLGRIILVSAFLFGIALIGLGQAQTLWLSLPLSALAGLMMMVQMAASNTVIQTLADEDKRGRVMSFFSMAVFGMTPFGSLMAGALADRLGAGRTLLVCGVGCALGAILFMRALPELRRQARPIYQRLGIVPELASGIQTATQASTQAAS